MEYVKSFWAILCEMAPFLMLGFLFAGILHVAVPAKLYTNYLSANNFRSVFFAALFGVPLPLCSCGVIPTAMSIRREGASKGATTAFLTATPQTGIDSILATYSVLGLPFAIIRPIVAFVTSLFAGIFTNWLDKDTSAKERVEQANTSRVMQTQRHSVKEVLKYGYLNMLQDIGGNLIVGLMVAGLIAVFVPDSFFLSFSQNRFLEMGVVLLIAIPMYVCATGSIPVAAALMLKGLSPGAALVFLMAGPATNFASLLVVRKVLGNRTLWIYLSSITLGAISFGLIINYLLPQEWFVQIKQTAACCAEEIPLWKQILSAVFTLLLLNALIRKRLNKHKSENMNNTVVYHIKGMSCNHCKSSVESNLMKMPKVESVNADLATGEVTVKGYSNPEEVRKIIEELGFVFLS